MSLKDERDELSTDRLSGYFDVLVSSEPENRPPNEDRIRGITR
jgi:hypothetical protein